MHTACCMLVRLYSTIVRDVLVLQLHCVVCCCVTCWDWGCQCQLPQFDAAASGRCACVCYAVRKHVLLGASELGSDNHALSVLPAAQNLEDLVHFGRQHLHVVLQPLELGDRFGVHIGVGA